jgi:dienelactone hydrolase
MIALLIVLVFGALNSTSHAQSQDDIAKRTAGGSSARVDALAAKIEVYSFQTMTLTDEQFLIGVKEAPPVTITGFLRIPPTRGGKTRLPAVIIVHGSAGIIANEDGWSRQLNELGIATFVLDCFTGRGIIDTGSDQGQVGILAPIIDAYRALQLLSKHPRIDPARIAIMGGSRGGRVALYASMRRFQRMYAPKGLEFAAYIPFYAPCYMTFIGDDDVSDKPIRLFHGEADDYVPVAPCRSYVQRLRKAGKDVQLTEYPGANHLFDNPNFATATPVPGVQTLRRCTIEEQPIGRMIVRGTERLFTFTDPCVEHGVTIGYNAQAHSEAIRAVEQFLRATFNLK